MKKQTTKQAAESAAYRARHDEIGKILDNRGIRAALAEVSKGLERMTLRREIVKFLHEIEFRISASLEFQDGTKEGHWADIGPLKKGIDPVFEEQWLGPDHLEPAERKRRKIMAIANDERGDAATRAVAQAKLRE